MLGMGVRRSRAIRFRSNSIKMRGGLRSVVRLVEAGLVASQFVGLRNGRLVEDIDFIDAV
jgi:hypothetical protein